MYIKDLIKSKSLANLLIMDRVYSFIKDDFTFEPYYVNHEQNGYICKCYTSVGMLIIRYGGSSHAYSSGEQIYEVKYPSEPDPLGYQTAELIWEYILMVANSKIKL
jgi:hypothetical protein